VFVAVQIIYMVVGLLKKYFAGLMTSTQAAFI